MKPNPYLYDLLHNCRSPKIVEETGDGKTYIGDCLPSCTGYGDEKWLIKLVAVDKESGFQRVFYANGSRHYDQAWNNRYNLEYRPTEPFDTSIEDTDRSDIPDGCLATADGTPILTFENAYMIVNQNN